MNIYHCYLHLRGLLCEKKWLKFEKRILCSFILSCDRLFGQMESVGPDILGVQIKDEPYDNDALENQEQQREGNHSLLGALHSKSGEIFRVNRGEYRMECAHCDQTFDTFDQFVMHIEQHFLNDFAATSPVIEKHEPYDQLFSMDYPFVAALIADDPVAPTTQRMPQAKHRRKHQKAPKKCRIPTNEQRSSHGTKVECLQCGGVFKSAATLQDHIRRIHSKRSHPCHLCRRAFICPLQLDFHMLRTHIVAKKYECYVCHKKYAKFSDMRNHMKSAHVRYRSEGMGVLATTSTSIANINIITKTEPKTFQCDICGIVFGESKHLYRHTENEHRDQLVGTTCDICDHVFANVLLLNRHMKKWHVCTVLGPRQFECYLCHKTSPTLTGVRAHYRINHVRELKQQVRFMCNVCRTPNECEHMRTADDGQMLCKVCQKKFSNLENIRLHMRYHVQKPHRCPYCSHACIKMSRMQYHIKVKHLNEKPEATEPCPVCKKLFAKRNLKKHVENVHVDPDSRPHICTYCGKGFPTKTRLGIHVIDHKYYGKYQCQLCPKHFARPHLFRDHINKAHNGEGAGDQLK